MLLGFKRQFAQYVEEGSKTHTIRAIRKITPRVGETCHCYVDPRQKSMRLLGRFKCVKVERITITFIGCGGGGTWCKMSIDGVGLEFDEARMLAWRDGFREFGESGAFSEFMNFWIKTHHMKTGETFEGHLIHWEYKSK